MDDNQFRYTYTALTEQDKREIERIREDYVGAQDKLATLKRLDGKVRSRATVWSLVVGISGTLIFGLGLALCLEWHMFILGTVISAVGIIPVAVAYPVYNLVKKRNKERYKDKIIALADELLNNK